MEAKDKILAACAALGLTMTAEFVPWSRSRNAKPTPTLTDRSLNWRVSIYKQAPGAAFREPILTTDYGAGIAHCPSYKANARQTLDYAEKIARETETGRPSMPFGGGKPIMPEFADVMASLVLDAGVLDHATFESWASEYDMDADSRKAETIYRACLEIALKLRNAVGEAGLQQLQEAAQDY